jgi:hypothetical protein
MGKYSMEDLKKLFDEQMQRLLSVVDSFPWEDKSAYSHWLGQSYHLVRHTTRFATYTASRIDFDHEPLHKHLLRHLREEVGHEMLAYNDLKNIGSKIEDVPKTTYASLMIQTQYYWIGVSPFAHFGFIWVLESLASYRGAKVMERIKKVHGDKCYSFWDVHTEVDADHAAEIFEVVKKFDPSEYERVAETVTQTVYLYSQMLHEIEAKVLSKKSAA